MILFLQDDIIPENVRKNIAEQEKNKEMEDLYLPPRRKNMQANNADNGKHCISFVCFINNTYFRRG